MEDAGSAEARFALREGWLCLDFANTVDWRRGDHPEELIHDYADLLAWSRQAGTLDAAGSARLAQEAAAHPAGAGAALDRARALREIIYRLFVAAVAEEPPAAGDLAAFNAALAGALAHAAITRGPAAGFAWEWAGAADAPDRMLWPIVRSAADLLTSPDLARVRVCEGQGCGWLLADTSKNHSRRWCSMEGCGNRAKARRHYGRRRATGAVGA